MAPPIPIEDFPAFLKEVATQAEKELSKGVLSAAQILAGDIAETIMAEPAAPSPASIRTGNLARSYLQGVAFLGIDGGKVSAKTTSTLVYAGIQDRGGLISPSTRQYLSVPLSMEAAKRWPRDWPQGRGGLFLIKSKRGNLILAKRAGKKGLKPVYVLKKQVEIPAKRYLERAREQAQPKIDTLVADALIEPVRKTG